MNERTINAEPSPISDFSNCHSGILRGLDAFAELPGLVEAMGRARQVAQQVQAVFEDAVIEHHAQEEKELFPAVLASAVPGEEREKVKEITDRLTMEHREVEAMWKRLAPQVKKVAKGQEVTLDVAEVQRLVSLYVAHARFEEAAFLPLSEEILARDPNHMAALGMSLHMRHLPSINHFV